MPHVQPFLDSPVAWPEQRVARRSSPRARRRRESIASFHCLPFLRPHGLPFSPCFGGSCSGAPSPSPTKSLGDCAVNLVTIVSLSGCVGELRQRLKRPVEGWSGTRLTRLGKP